MASNGRYNERDLDLHDPRDKNRDRSKVPDEGRNRSRSPRRDRGGGGGGGGGRNNRYRSRSPIRRDRDDRSARGGPHRDRDSRYNNRDTPRGPRGGGPPSGPRKDNRPSGRSETQTEDVKDEPMEEAPPKKEKPEGVDDDTWEMMQVMGFGMFKSTKNKKVPGNDKNFGVRKDKKMEARQYMNRQGGFNRPLSPGRG